MEMIALMFASSASLFGCLSNPVDEGSNTVVLLVITNDIPFCVEVNIDIQKVDCVVGVPFGAMETQIAVLRRLGGLRVLILQVSSIVE